MCREYRFLMSRKPSWADTKAIASMYEQSKRKGSKYEVDHIVPLVNPFVCGLHCEFNLQIITRMENNKKSNLVWPNMWHEQLVMTSFVYSSYQLGFNF